MAEATNPNAVWAPVLMVAGVVGIGVLLVVSIRGKIARRNSERPSPREMIDRFKAARDRPGDAQGHSAQLVETARRLSAQLDNKAERLELLIRQADERIARFSEAVPAGRHTTGEPPPGQEPTATPQSPPPGAGEPPRSDPLTRAVYELADAGRSPVEIAQQLDEQVGKVELILALRAA
jgi:hypothetical protein